MLCTSATFLCLLSTLPHGVVGVTLVTEKETQTMRREPRPHAVQLSPSGEMIDTKQKGDTESSSPEDFCEWDFPLGKEGSTGESSESCNDAANHSIVMNEKMCIKAGKLAGVSTVHDRFSLTHWDFDYHPKGCFYQSCSEDKNHHCYWFNGDGATPAGPGIHGTPVCKRDKYRKGATDSIGGAEGGCVDGYEVVTDEAKCKAAAKCMGHCPGKEFRMGKQTAAEHLLYPEGCFIHSEHKNEKGQNCIYLNDYDTEALGKPTKPKGTPVCQVKKTTTFAGKAAASATKLESKAPAEAAGAKATKEAATATKKEAEKADGKKDVKKAKKG